MRGDCPTILVIDPPPSEPGCPQLPRLSSLSRHDDHSNDLNVHFTQYCATGLPPHKSCGFFRQAYAESQRGAEAEPDLSPTPPKLGWAQSHARPRSAPSPVTENTLPLAFKVPARHLRRNVVLSSPGSSPRFTRLVAFHLFSCAANIYIRDRITLSDGHDERSASAFSYRRWP